MRVKDMTLIALFAGLIALCSWLSIPAAVPFTMQTFGIFVAVGLLGGRRGTLAVVLYILLGAIGLPVFAGFGAGIGVIFSAVGGYIIGFIFTALTMWAITGRFGFGLISLAVSMALGLLICYAFGTAWFMAVYSVSNSPMSFFSALSVCVLPFLVPDALKLALALVITLRLRKLKLIALS